MNAALVIAATLLALPILLLAGWAPALLLIVAGAAPLVVMVILLCAGKR